MKLSLRTVVRTFIVLIALSLVAAVASGAPCRVARQRAAATTQERPALPPTAYSDLVNGLSAPGR